VARRRDVHGLRCDACIDLVAVIADGARGSSGGGSASWLSASGFSGASRTLPIDAELLVLVRLEDPVAVGSGFSSQGGVFQSLWIAM
jgi:hypothetical protein